MASDNTISAPTPRASVFEPGTKHSFYGSFPRELRDKIYDQIISEKEEVFKSACCKMRSTVPKVRLLCKQFKQEYDERCPKLNHLQIFSCYIRCPKTYWSPDPTPIPPLGIQATSLQYHTIWCEHKLGSGEPCKKDIRTDMLWKNIGRQLGEYIEDFPHLAEFNLIISCSSLTCARAVVASDGASRSWGWISGQPRVSLLMPNARLGRSIPACAGRFRRVDECQRMPLCNTSAWFEIGLPVPQSERTSAVELPQPDIHALPTSNLPFHALSLEAARIVVSLLLLLLQSRFKSLTSCIASYTINSTLPFRLLE